eukprot:TRINITY_DN6726_c0_g1_i2.p1 TRINITY_DN6726_c0_g1~~TRINITY_DN6726_c0_g1_i2.p1  ORF type:complete len:147 (-),score=6.22 TRINITY_DN6726_c0_g1_i2:75-515(-)
MILPLSQRRRASGTVRSRRRRVLYVVALIFVSFAFVMWKAPPRVVITDSEVADEGDSAPVKVLRPFKWAEIVPHNDMEDLFLVIYEQVYNVTDFVPTHPGGDNILFGAGVNATDQFEGHPDYVRDSLLPQYHVGWLEDDAPAPIYE